MAELNTITIKGFKSILSIENLKLSAINVIVGPNGSGKSNFIGVFAFLNAIQTGRLQEYVIKAGGDEKILYFGSKVTEKLYIKISFANDLSMSTNEIKTAPSFGNTLAEAIWLFANDAGKFLLIPMTSPVDFISGPKIRSAP